MKLLTDNNEDAQWQWLGVKIINSIQRPITEWFCREFKKLIGGNTLANKASGYK